MRTILLMLLFFLTGILTYGQGGLQYKWVKGAYFDLKGERHRGFISRQKKTPGAIWFKTESESGMNKLSPENIKSFVAGADSFVVSRASYLKQYPFLRVVINGTLKMYVSTQMIASAPSKSTPQYQYNIDLYYYGSNPDNLTEIKGINFFDAMDKILISKPGLLKKIKRKEYTFNDMEEIVAAYNGTKPGETKEKTKTN
jgi:hypothetical protein